MNADIVLGEGFGAGWPQPWPAAEALALTRHELDVCLGEGQALRRVEYCTWMEHGPSCHDCRDYNGAPKPRNPRHFGTIEGGRNSVSSGRTTKKLQRRSESLK